MRSSTLQCRVDARLSKLTTEALVHAAEMDMISFVVAASAELDEPQHQSQYKILQARKCCTVACLTSGRPYRS